jgi:hypothetical protein
MTASSVKRGEVVIPLTCFSSSQKHKYPEDYRVLLLTQQEFPNHADHSSRTKMCQQDAACFR